MGCSSMNQGINPKTWLFSCTAPRCRYAKKFGFTDTFVRNGIAEGEHDPPEIQFVLSCELWDVVKKIHRHCGLEWIAVATGSRNAILGHLGHSSAILGKLGQSLGYLGQPRGSCGQPQATSGQPCATVPKDYPGFPRSFPRFAQDTRRLPKVAYGPAGKLRQPWVMGVPKCSP